MAHQPDKYTVTLTLHPAFKQTVPLPIAVLDYRKLGLRCVEAMYLIHILTNHLLGHECSVPKIAEQMGINPRTLYRYNTNLKEREILTYDHRYQDGSQIKNNYDLNRWLSLADSLKRRQDAAMDTLLDQLDGIESIEQARQIIEEWRAKLPPDLGSPPPPDPRSGGKTDLPPDRGGDLGSGHIVVVDPLTLTANDNEDPTTTNKDGEKNGTKPALVDNLLAAGVSDRRTASYILYEARQHFGDGLADAVAGWLRYMNGPTAEGIRNPGAFLRSKLVYGVEPPTPPAPADAADYRIPDHLKDIIKR